MNQLFSLTALDRRDLYLFRLTYLGLLLFETVSFLVFLTPRLGAPSFLAAAAVVAVLAPALLLAPPLGLRLGVRRQRTGRGMGSAGRPRAAGHDGAELQQREDDGGAIAGQIRLGLRSRERAGTKGGEELRIESRSRCRHDPGIPTTNTRNRARPVSEG